MIISLLTLLFSPQPALSLSEAPCLINFLLRSFGRELLWETLTRHGVLWSKFGQFSVPIHFVWFIGTHSTTKRNIIIVATGFFFFSSPSLGGSCPSSTDNGGHI